MKQSPFDLPRSRVEQNNLKDESPATSKMPEDCPAEESLEEWRASKQEWLILIALMVTCLMVSIDSTILVPILPTLASDLHGTATSIFWAGTAFLLANAVLQPFLAALSDIFGRRNLLLACLLLFTAGTIICCTSNAVTQFLVGRAVQGVGAGGISVSTIVILTDIVPLRQRPKYNTLISLSFVLGTITGPLVGGLIVQHTTWRWIFYLNFPFCGVGLGLSCFGVRLNTEKVTLKQKISRVDWFGGALFIGGMTSFLLAVTWGGVEFSWTSFRTIVPLALGVVGILAALAWEVRGTQTPFLRLGLFNNRSAILTYACSLLQGLLLYQATYYIPFYFEAAKGYSPTITGLALFALSMTVSPSNIIVGLLMTKTGRFRWALWGGWLLLVLSNGLLILFDEDTSVPAWIFILIVLGIAHGSVLGPLIFGTQAMARTEDVAYAAAMYIFLRTLGYSMGVAIGGTAFQNTLSTRLGDAGLPLSIARNAESYVAVLEKMPKASLEYQQLVQAYSSAFKTVWEIMTAFAALGLLLSLGVAHYSLDRKHESRHKSVGREKSENLETSIQSTT